VPPSIAAKIGYSAHALLDSVKKAEFNGRKRPGAPVEVSENRKTPERKSRELRQANEMLLTASAFFALPELDRRSKS
jgi:transposase